MFTVNGLNAILNWWGGTSGSTSNYLYVGLSTTTPSQDGTGFTEPSQATYARALLNNRTSGGSGSTKLSSAQFDSVSGESYITNNQAVYFNETYNTSTGNYENWGTITHIGIFGSSTGGQLLAYAELDNSIQPGGVADTSNIVVIRVNDMRIGLKSGTASATI